MCCTATAGGALAARVAGGTPQSSGPKKPLLDQCVEIKAHIDKFNTARAELGEEASEMNGLVTWETKCAEAKSEMEASVAEAIKEGAAAIEAAMKFNPCGRGDEDSWKSGLDANSGWKDVVREIESCFWSKPGAIHAIETNVVLNDGTWHHVVVTWSSQNGNVVLYKDGAKVFDSLENDGEPYRKGVEMERSGVVMVGNVPLSMTQCNLSPISQPCNILPNTGLIGAVQNIRMYTEVLGSKGAVDDFLWPYFDHSNLQLKLYWRSIVSTFVNGNYNATINNLAIGNLKRQSIAEINAHVGITSMQGVAPLETSTIRSPCVEDDIWYFTAPSIFLGDFKNKMYNGRLQFQMLSPSNSGYERTRTGMVYVTGADGVTIANSVSGFIAPSAGKWTSYTIPFREDQGWSYYETGEAITFKNFRHVLSNLTSVQIRGDDRVCSNQGEGQEAVYVQNIYYEVEP